VESARLPGEREAKKKKTVLIPVSHRSNIGKRNEKSVTQCIRLNQKSQQKKAGTPGGLTSLSTTTEGMHKYGKKKEKAGEIN